MNHCGYEFDNGELSEAALMYLHSVLQVCAGRIFLLCLSIASFRQFVFARWDCSETRDIPRHISKKETSLSGVQEQWKCACVSA